MGAPACAAPVPEGLRVSLRSVLRGYCFRNESTPLLEAIEATRFLLPTEYIVIISSHGFYTRYFQSWRDHFSRFKCLFDRNLSTDCYRFFSEDIPLFSFYTFRFVGTIIGRNTWTFLFVGGIGREDKLVAAFTSAIRWFVERASGRRKF